MCISNIWRNGGCWTILIACKVFSHALILINKRNIIINQILKLMFSMFHCSIKFLSQNLSTERRPYQSELVFLIGFHGWFIFHLFRRSFELNYLLIMSWTRAWGGPAFCFASILAERQAQNTHVFYSAINRRTMIGAYRIIVQPKNK